MVDSSTKAAAAAAQKAKRSAHARQIKLVMRLEQVLRNKPGIYTFAVVVNDDGTWDLIVPSSNPKLEKLG